VSTCDICDKPVEPGQPRRGGNGDGGRSGARFGFERHYDCHTRLYGRPDSRPTAELFADLRGALKTTPTPASRPAVKRSLVDKRGPYNRSPNASREFKTFGVISEMGKRRIEVECPFCLDRFWAYLWSLSGGGKRCPNCGAMHASHGSAYPVEGNEGL
jgi:hypothetical protein